MPLTGEAKAEWRRKNREKIAAYTAEWKRRNQDKVKAMIARQVAKENLDPNKIAKRMFAERMKKDPVFAMEVMERKRYAKRKPKKKSIFVNGWTSCIVGKSLQKVCRAVAQSEWQKKCDSLGRAASFRQVVSRRTKSTGKKYAQCKTWRDFWLWQQVCFNNYAAARMRFVSSEINNKWRIWCESKCRQIYIRVIYLEVIENEKNKS